MHIVEYLLEHNAHLNQENNDGWTALHFAVYSGDVNITRYLLNKGSNINKQVN